MISVGELKVATLGGEGLFSSDHGKLATSFKLHRQLSRSVITIDDISVPLWAFAVDSFGLTGKLRDGRSLNVACLLPIQISESLGLIELVPLNCAVKIGSTNSSKPIEASYVLTGIFEGGLTIQLGDWLIQLVADDNAQSMKRISQGLKLPLDGLIMKLAAAERSEEDYDTYAQDIMLLLSLASGNGVSCHRWILSYPNQEFEEMWRSRSGDDIGPGYIVGHWNLEGFLVECLTRWQEMSAEDRSLIRLAINYLNTSGTGYVDTRLFQIVQAWEFVAAQWAPKGSLTEPEKELRETIKKCCREWRKIHPSADPDGAWGDRVLFAFEWPKLRRQIQALADRFGLDLVKVGIDLEYLKSARDSVAHQGTLGVADPSLAPHYKLLMNAQFGLQLLLLVKLGYTGDVEVTENGWRDHKPISHFLNT